ncbi:hypothetical protein ABIE65_003555 [Constrictibacter sp. MBR-5]|uniref:hypothetical protein n=1 Tax=Constrictibacter sp. MBR-5 TaxID=3156467 RepID=UPI00339AC264
MRIALVNRFCPPDPAPTGLAMAELAADLAAAMPEAEVRIFTTGGSYRNGGDVAATDIDGCVGVTRVPPVGFGARGVGRLVASLIDGRRLAARATAWADTVISLTDPPLQGFWMGRATRRRRVRWAEWTMDLYPQAFVAAGLAGAGNPIVGALAGAQRRRAPDLDICLGPAQLDHVRRDRGNGRAGLLLPTGLFDSEPLDPPDWRRTESRRVLAYAGNLGEAHSADSVARLVERASPERFLFLLAPHGSRAEALWRRLEGAPHVQWSERLDASALDHADAHIVSLRPGWEHVCVPSKALSAFSRGRPVLFLGPAESDSWRFACGAGWLVPEPPTDAAIDAALASVADPASLAEATEAAVAAHARLAGIRAEGLSRLIDWLRSARR